MKTPKIESNRSAVQTLSILPGCFLFLGSGVINEIMLLWLGMTNGMDSLSYSRNQDQYIHDFVAGAACYVTVAEAMSQTLRVLEVIHRAGVVVDGEEYALDFSREILKLKAALRVMGVDDGDGSETKLDA